MAYPEKKFTVILQGEIFGLTVEDGTRCYGTVEITKADIAKDLGPEATAQQLEDWYHQRIAQELQKRVQVRFNISNRLEFLRFIGVYEKK